MPGFLTKQKCVLLPVIDKVKKRGKTTEKWEEIHKEEGTAAQQGAMRRTEAQARGGCWKPHAGHLNSKAEQEQFNASASVGTFLNCLVYDVIRKHGLPVLMEDLQSVSSTPSPLKTASHGSTRNSNMEAGWPTPPYKVWFFLTHLILSQLNILYILINYGLNLIWQTYKNNKN